MMEEKEEDQGSKGGGVERWLVDISEWNPSDEEFCFILSLLPHHEHSSITRFVKFEDRKRAIISRLLQYALVHQVLGIPFNRITIKRTFEGKPYLETNEANLKFPNFNFNTSHHGDYVGIASETSYIVGLDIVSSVTPKHESPLELVRNFSSYFTSFEWDNIMNAGTCDEILGHFYRYWCLKESFIKAIGAGLGYELNKLEFHHTNWTNIYVHINGKKSIQWRFWLCELGKKHWVSIARGHPSSAIKSYKATLHLTKLEPEYPSSHHFATNFVLRTVEELLPVSFKVGYGIFAENRVHDDTETGDVADVSSSGT